MNNKDTEKEELAQGYAKFRSMVWAVDAFSWKWLAITTGIMVYSSFEQSVLDHFSPITARWVLAAIVLIFYMIIDHGLPETMASWMTAKPKEQDQQAYRTHKKLINFIFIFFIVRIFATGLSSIWAGGEIGDITTRDFDPTTYTAAAAKRDSSDNARLSMASGERDQLRVTEADRMAAAEAKGKAEIRAEVMTGNQSQRDMWKNDPGFFSAIPRNQWYAGNKAFADRVHAAQERAKKYLADEQQKTDSAENLLYAVTSDTTASSYIASLARAADGERTHLAAKEGRRTRMIIISDVLAIVFGLLCRYILIYIDQVTERKVDTRSLSYLIARAMEAGRVWFLEFLENLLGLDLDNNGTVGSVKNRMQSNGIGFQMKGNNPSNAVVPEPEITPSNPIGYFFRPTPSTNPPHPIQPEDTQWPPVATASIYHEIEPEVLELAYKHAKSSKQKWEAKEANRLGTTKTNQKNIQKWQQYMLAIKQRIEEVL